MICHAYVLVVALPVQTWRVHLTLGQGAFCGGEVALRGYRGWFLFHLAASDIPARLRFDSSSRSKGHLEMSGLRQGPVDMWRDADTNSVYKS